MPMLASSVLAWKESRYLNVNSRSASSPDRPGPPLSMTFTTSTLTHAVSYLGCRCDNTCMTCCTMPLSHILCIPFLGYHISSKANRTSACSSRWSIQDLRYFEPWLTVDESPTTHCKHDVSAVQSDL